MVKRQPTLAWGIKQVGGATVLEAEHPQAALVFTTRKAAREEVARWACRTHKPECVVRVEIREVGIGKRVWRPKVAT